MGNTQPPTEESKSQIFHSEKLSQDRPIKTALTVSLGSDKRDFERTILINDVAVKIKRIGVNGDMKEMRRVLSAYDGKVDAIGLGGCQLSLYFGDQQWAFREFKFVHKVVKHTPVTDGRMVRKVIERSAINVFKEHESEIFEQPKSKRTVLATSVVDRYDMVHPFVEDDAYDVVFGDLMFGLGLPIGLRNFTIVKVLVYILAPILAKIIPFRWLYPLGEAQEKHEEQFVDVYRQSDVILSDSHYVTTTCPTLEGKCLITNTVTKNDLQIFRKAKLKALITTTPMIDDRSCGTNALEAAIIAASGLKRVLTVEEMEEVVAQNRILKPQFHTDFRLKEE